MTESVITLHHGDCRDVLATLGDASVDSIVTDPPYEIAFMGRSWDNAGVAFSADLWQQCYRVLKPGGHLLAFGGTRTYHRMACAIEDAGFEIRDSIHWLYGSGFPKSLDVAKAIDKAAGKEGEVIGERHFGKTSTGQASGWNANAVAATGKQEVRAPATDEAKKWSGFGTALKPAHEPIVLARKPLEGTVAANVVAHNTGALNIDGTRVRRASGDVSVAGHRTATFGTQDTMSGGDGSGGWSQNNAGRWPANLVFTHSAGCVQIGTKPDTFGGGARGSSGFVEGYDGGGFVGQTVSVPVYECATDCPISKLDQQSGETKSQGGRIGKKEHGAVAIGGAGTYMAGDPGYGDTGGASRYFTVTEWDPIADAPFRYVAKPSKKERNAGLDGLPAKREADRTKDDGAGGDNPRNRSNTAKVNHHPTVKPLALMRWLIRLVTPPGGVVLDPFAGSGTTLAAAVLEDFDAIGCEMTAEYLPIIEGRVAWAKSQATNNAPTNTAHDVPTNATHQEMLPYEMEDI